MSNMIENLGLSPKLVKNVDPDLQLTKKRTIGPLPRAASSMGGCVSTGTFSMGADLIGASTVGRAVFAMAIGYLIIAVALVVIGNCGHKYGISYMIQLRGNSDTIGAKVPGLLRGIPAIIWSGPQSWVGAGAINSCLSVLFGFDNLPLVYALFTMLQAALAIKGSEDIEWLEDISCVFIITILVRMLYVVKMQLVTEIDSVSSGIRGAWDMPFQAAATSSLKIYSTMIISVSDYSHSLEGKVGPIFTRSIYAAAVLPATPFMGLIGLLVTVATDDDNPVVVLSTTMGSKFLTVVTSLFTMFAQVAINTLNSIVPPSYVLMESFHVKWPHVTILVGILSACCTSWRLAADDLTADLGLFTQFYSTFLGPIFTAMAMDYYILRRKKLSINHIYGK